MLPVHDVPKPAYALHKQQRRRRQIRYHANRMLRPQRIRRAADEPAQDAPPQAYPARPDERYLHRVVLVKAPVVYHMHQPRANHPADNRPYRYGIHVVGRDALLRRPAPHKIHRRCHRHECEKPVPAQRESAGSHQKRAYVNLYHKSPLPPVSPLRRANGFAYRRPAPCPANAPSPHFG